MSETITDNTSLDLLQQTESAAEQYLAFELAGEQYAVDILRVEHIKAWECVTPIPNTPPYLCGVINLRGAIVPVVDLRLRFGLPLRPYSKTTVLAILKVGTRQQRLVGIVVDEVLDAYPIRQEMLKAIPDIEVAVETQFLAGLADVNNKMVMILDIDRLLSVEAIG